MYLCSGNSPYFEVIGAHKDVGKALTDIAYDPFIEVLGLVCGRSHTSFESRIQKSIHALGFLFLGEERNVVLERVRNPLVLVSHVRDALVLEPVVWLGQSLLNNVVKVFVVREDDVAANIVKLTLPLAL